MQNACQIDRIYNISNNLLCLKNIPSNTKTSANARNILKVNGL